MPCYRLTAHLLLCLLSALPFNAVGQGSSCLIERIVPERLPDLTIPRSGHNIFYANGELTVTGGHTTNFVPTPTAEYFAYGEWHQLTMAYTHDNGFAVTLRSGDVLIGGGHEEPLGIGQTFMLERYHPLTHTFEGFGCLDRRRVLANATQIADGRVIISGNNFADDAIACYDGRSQVQHVKDATQGRDLPYILPIAHDDAIVFGPRNTHASMHDTVWADRLEGEAFRVPLLEQWKLLPTDQPFSSMACFIGDEQKGDYSYLLTATDESGQLAIILATNRPTSQPPNFPNDQSFHFSLMPTACPIPMESDYGPVFYKGPIVVDRQHQRGYVMGVDSLYHRQYVLAVDYAKRPAALTLYHTDSIEHATITIPIVTPDGDLILAGGIPCDNYKPLSTVWCYHFGTDTPLCNDHVEGQPVGKRWGVWLWVVLAVVVLAGFAYIIIYRATGASGASEATGTSETTGAVGTTNITKRPNDQELTESLCLLLEERQLYLKSRLKISDIATELGVSVGSISDSLAACRGITFTQLLAEYRVRHAQQLLAEQPDMKLTAVYTESGFTSESTFFRTFKAVTGLSPKEWLAQQ